MRRIAKILVPTDFSAPSTAALEYAKAFAAEFGASLHLLHVLDDPFATGAWSSEIYVGDMPELRMNLRREAERRLGEALAPAEYERYRVTTEVLAGRAAPQIAEAAARQSVDLIVMGTHGRSGVAHLLLGSVAEKVVRIAPCPVLTVRGNGRARELAEQPKDAWETPLGAGA